MPKLTVLMHGASIGTDAGVIGFCSVILIEGERRILFDSAHVGRRTYLEAQLAAQGLTTDDIDAQVLSHAHWDHVQNCDLFPNAPMLVHRDEVRYAHKPHRNDWATPAWTGAVLDTMALEEVGEGHEIMSGCRVIELTGHSPGSIGLEVETEDGICILTGDAVHNAGVAVRGRSPLVFWNQQDADASIKRVVESGAAVYPGHDMPFRLRDGEIDYMAEQSITVSGPPSTILDTTVRPPGEPWVMPGIEDQKL
ncbi:MAG TPA: MBL fold metallo-hydrolase [Dehalococcoidia bacterium]|jgi:glyoxylase-like metal-dependent hydrolase (beta-lactamase superfamily II)|nr:MBL fold metallo-hydrolase [Dehalococcoidia bacterium]